MLRKFLCAMFALVVCVGFSLAAEIKGKVKSVDAEKGTITVTVGDKDQTFTVAKDAKISLPKKIKELKDIKPDTDVVLTTEGEGDKAVVKTIAAPKKDKQN